MKKHIFPILLSLCFLMLWGCAEQTPPTPVTEGNPVTVTTTTTSETTTTTAEVTTTTAEVTTTTAEVTTTTTEVTTTPTVTKAPTSVSRTRSTARTTKNTLFTYGEDGDEWSYRFTGFYIVDILKYLGDKERTTLNVPVIEGERGLHAKYVYECYKSDDLPPFRELTIGPGVRLTVDYTFINGIHPMDAIPLTDVYMQPGSYFGELMTVCYDRDNDWAPVEPKSVPIIHMDKSGAELDSIRVMYFNSNPSNSCSMQEAIRKVWTPGTEAVIDLSTLDLGVTTCIGSDGNARPLALRGYISFE